MNTRTTKKVAISGIRTTGSIHFGNYIGAIRQFKDFQNDPDTECFFFIANMHSITEKIDPEVNLRGSRDLVRAFLASGVDPNKSTIYAQSNIPELFELQWLLSCFCTISDLTGMPHFKEKNEQGKKKKIGATPGLLTYPILMAADILGVHATEVPVGPDQEYHVEFAVKIVREFNRRFGHLLAEPKASIGTKLESLSGDGKMGKSTGNAIPLSVSDNDLRKMVKAGATTRVRLTDAGNLDKCPIHWNHQVFSPGETISWVQQGCSGASISCFDCKMRLADHMISETAEVRENFRQQLALPDDNFDEILHEGSKVARKIIAEVTNKAKYRLGLKFF